MKREKIEFLNIKGEDIVLVRKDIKNIYIVVERPCGTVRVSAPWRASVGAVREVVERKYSWVVATRERVKKSSFKESSGDIFRECFLFGEKYHINLFKGKRADVKDLDGSANITLKDPGNKEQLQSVVDCWHRVKLIEYIENNKDKWESVVGEKANEWRVKKMKTRWGSCNTRDRRVWLSLSLAKERAAFIDYIMVHELLHLIEKRHNKRFYSLMDHFYPQWRNFKKSGGNLM